MSQTFFVHPSSIVDAGCVIGEGTKVWHFCHIMSCKIGNNCNIGQNVFIASGVKLGNNVKIQNNVSIYAGVECEDDVFLGPSMVFTNILNPRSHVVRKEKYIHTIVQKGASIGANATIVCGVTIGKYALIGAGSVLTKSALPYSLMMGNPARQTGWVSEWGNKLVFGNDGFALCNESGDRYQLNDGKVEKC
jgi:UDP-2-acetamido-3-amino-2,3-dideoxy-glucuronate N-acetyltransferase